MYIPSPAKLLFQIDDGWGKLLTQYGDAIPEWTQLVVERMLACDTPAMGLRRYCGASPPLHTHQVHLLQLQRERLNSHIPLRHFKMVRYYGFLSNRKSGELLPKIYAALKMEVKTKLAKSGYATLMKQFTQVAPY